MKLETAERESNPLLWKLRTGPLRALRILQRRLGVRRVPCSYLGARFSVDILDQVGFDVATGRYEHTDLVRFLKACDRLHPSLFVDVGANIGVYSCILGVRGFNVFSLEPDPESFAALNGHIASNGLLSRSRTMRAAVGAEGGQSVGLIQGHPRNRGMVSVTEAGAGHSSAPMVRLDALDLPRDSCIAIKMDIEGYEAQAIRGGAELFLANRGFAQIEASDDNAPEIAELMRPLGWRQVDRYGLNVMFEK